MTSLYSLRSLEGFSPEWDVIEHTVAGGFRIGSVYQSSDRKAWCGTCTYGGWGHAYKGNLCGNSPAVPFESKEAAAEAVYNEKVRRTQLNSPTKTK